jgi:hypothetical protein
MTHVYLTRETQQEGSGVARRMPANRNSEKVNAAPLPRRCRAAAAPLPLAVGWLGTRPRAGQGNTPKGPSSQSNTF